MSNLFKETARRLENSPFVIFITMAFVVMFIIAVGITIEDYSTTLAGYKLLPTAKVNDWVMPLVALLPQVGQIGFAYLFATDTNKRWALLTAFALHFVDVGTDVFYKAYGQGPAVWLAAFIESEVIYTLGSEVMLAASFGMMIYLMPSAIAQTGHILHRIWAASTNADTDELSDHRSDAMRR